MEAPCCVVPCHDTAIEHEWRRYRDEAANAKKRGEPAAIRRALLAALLLRPDWVLGCAAADGVLRDEFTRCAASLSATLARGADAQGLCNHLIELSQAITTRSGPDAPCRLLGLQTTGDDGEALLIYRNAANAEALAPVMMAARPLKLLILDVDGVLNTSGDANTGCLDPALMARLLTVVARTGCVVALSSSWRSFDELRPLIVAGLPLGCVLGQTPRGFENYCRPREIAELLGTPLLQTLLQEPGASWVAVDDMDLLRQARSLASTERPVRKLIPELERRFVRTDKTVGLDDAALAALLTLLL